MTPPVDNVSKQQPPQEGTNPSPELPIDPPSLVPTEPIALTALNEQVAVLQENMESIKSGIQPEKLKEINGTIEMINANMNTAEDMILLIATAIAAAIPYLRNRAIIKREMAHEG